VDGIAHAAGARPVRAGRRYGVVVVVVLVAVALVAWLVTFARMDGMDDGPGTALGALPWYVGVWVTMMAAMMLPAVAPVAQLVARTNAGRLGRRAGAARTALFLATYVLVWTGYGLAAYAAYRAIAAVEDGVLAWDRAGPYVAGGAVAAAGLYQLTPLKRDEGHVAVARRPVDGDSRLHQAIAGRVDVVDLVGEVSEIAVLAVFLLVPIIGQLDQRRAAVLRSGLEQGFVLRRAQEHQRKAALVVVDPAYFLQPQRVLVKLHRGIEIANAQHGVEIAHFGELLEKVCCCSGVWGAGQ
jgi:hypothetical protein